MILVKLVMCVMGRADEILQLRCSVECDANRLGGVRPSRIKPRPFKLFSSTKSASLRGWDIRSLSSRAREAINAS
jgi:hypothetical protein